MGPKRGLRSGLARRFPNAIGPPIEVADSGIRKTQKFTRAAPLRNQKQKGGTRLAERMVRYGWSWRRHRWELTTPSTMLAPTKAINAAAMIRNFCWKFGISSA